MFNKSVIAFSLILLSVSSALGTDLSKECGPISEWLHCVDNCQNKDSTRRTISGHHQSDCRSECTEMTKPLFEQAAQIEVAKHIKPEPNEKECLKSCWCSNADTRHGLKGIPCHQICKRNPRKRYLIRP